MGTTHTTLTIDENLLLTAKELNINMSAALDKALKIEIGLPAQREALEVEINKLKAQLGFAQAKLEEFDKKAIIDKTKETKDDLNKYIGQLKKYRKMNIEKKLSDEKFREMCVKVVNAFDKDFSEIIDRVNSSSYTTLEEQINEGAEE